MMGGYPVYSMCVLCSVVKGRILTTLFFSSQMSRKLWSIMRWELLSHPMPHCSLHTSFPHPKHIHTKTTELVGLSMNYWIPNINLLGGQNNMHTHAHSRAHTCAWTHTHTHRHNTCTRTHWHQWNPYNCASTSTQMPFYKAMGSK